MIALAGRAAAAVFGSWKWLAAIAAIGAAAYAGGYHGGSVAQLEKINEDQRAQMADAIETLETFHGETITIMRDVAAANEELSRNVADIPRPTVSTCVLPDDWLHAYQASVRATNRARASAGADAAADRTDER